MKPTLLFALLLASVMTASASPVAVPEGGSSMVLLGAGVAGIAAFRRMFASK